MEKIKQTTTDITEHNIEKVAKLFPNVITESTDENGNIKKAIDFERLKQELSRGIATDEENYDFTWVGKKQALIEANTPTNKTLRPCKAESVNWDKTENIYIEGDNLEVLKLLQETYLNKIKMIYIDPPYNTGKDLLYRNNFLSNLEEYEEELCIEDEEGNKLFKNTETNGRFHSNWCSMMYERLKLARNLLTDDGFIVIAIDDNELFNLGSICDEIFGCENRIGVVTVVHKPEGRNQAKFFGTSNEYALFYSKNKDIANFENVVLDPAIAEKYNLKDNKGNYRLQNFIRLTDGKLAYRSVRPKFWYPIYVDCENNIITTDKDKYPNLIPVYPKTKLGVEMSWKVLPKSAEELIKNNELEINKDEDGFISIMEKIRETQVIKTHWIRKEYNAIQYGTKIVNNLFGTKYFDFPKSIFLIEDTLKLTTKKDSIVLDFFSGSATTAHAVMQLNAEDGGNRKFIMVQLPEQCNEESEAYQDGYKNICEIGKERIRLAGKQLIEQTGKKDLDIGFRVFKIDESNMKDVYFSPDEYNQGTLDQIESNIKEDRNSEDLLFSCMLNWGLELSLPHKIEKIGNNEIHIVNENELVACFDTNISEEVIRKIADIHPLRVVFRDNSFGKDSDRINIEEIFKLKSPNTKIKVL